MGKLIEWTNKADKALVLPDCPNFQRYEFSCHCAHPHINQIESRLIYALQKLREWLKKPIKITSGFRCPEHNHIIGGVADSKHCLGIAADIVIAGFTVAEYERTSYKLKQWGCNAFGIDKYKGKFMHIDTRPEKDCRLGTVRW